MRRDLAALDSAQCRENCVCLSSVACKKTVIATIKNSTWPGGNDSGQWTLYDYYE